ncbi:ABC transporter substrate-binding protein [Pollutimonas bauzanensis]|uniref:Iron(III) transport system substrate-binding protein n=1 Tax=Pollutimonas bauzanensis TaxID=658167 RepID=A0A1M5X9P4_9BURK|nr:extracellular solute-binding protein [Pollutimonas bauzanensis]SHH96254.1 iron(III) transport system substrate-binding protein [Pollutimonas bauzanensis]
MQLIGKKALAAAAVAMSIGSGFAMAQPAAPYGASAELVGAAQKEGKVVFYTSVDLKVAEKLAAAFQAKYPGITVQVERGGSERNFQRINQEYGSKIYNIDVIDSPDAFHFSYFKRQGWLAPAVPDDLAKWPAEEKDPEGLFASSYAFLSIIAYNTQLVSAQDAPRSHADLLDPKWQGKIVKAHPAYSGAIMTATYALGKTLGWDYFQKLGRQDVMQIQSATATPQKVAQGERAVMADGTDYNVFILKAAGAPIQEVYPAEGSPLLTEHAGVLKQAPHPNAARLFYHYLFSQEGQQILVDAGKMRSFHPDVKEIAGRKPLSEIKLLHADPDALEREIDTIKQNYAKYFGT